MWQGKQSKCQMGKVLEGHLYWDWFIGEHHSRELLFQK